MHGRKSQWMIVSRAWPKLKWSACTNDKQIEGANKRRPSDVNWKRVIGFISFFFFFFLRRSRGNSLRELEIIFMPDFYQPVVPRRFYFFFFFFFSKRWWNDRAEGKGKGKIPFPPFLSSLNYCFGKQLLKITDSIINKSGGKFQHFRILLSDLNNFWRVEISTSIILKSIIIMMEK